MDNFNINKQLTFKLSGKQLKVNAEITLNKIYLTFPYFEPALEQVKAMAGSEWIPAQERWAVDNCHRNWFAFDVLARGPRSARYFKDPAVYEPNYTRRGISFHKHQQEMYNFERDRRRCMIGAEPRTEKTWPALQCFYDSPHDFCLWVTTNSAMLGSVREMRKWFSAELRYKRSENRYALSGSKTVYLCSYDHMVSTQDLWVTQPPGFIIFDECHCLKNPSSVRGKAANELSIAVEEYYKDEEYVIGLSGTPAPLDPSDWWHQCEVIRRGYIREGTLSKFKGRYGDYKPWDGLTPAWERFEGFNKEKVAELATRLRGLVRIFFFKDCHDLPPIRFERVRLPAPKSLLRVAKLIAETSESQLETRRRLRQLSDGFEYNKEYDEEKNEFVRSGSTFLGSVKVEQLKRDIEEYSEVGRMVVYAAFKASITIVRETYLEAGWHVLQLTSDKALYTPDGKRLGDDASIQLALDGMDRSTNDYKIGKLAVVADTISGGTGLEFSASPVTIYYSNSDNGGGRMQANFRIYSSNTDKVRGATIKDYILLHTDEKILDQQEAKKEMQDISMGDLASIINQQYADSTVADSTIGEE